MCLFPLPNLQFNSLSYKKGVREFDCGACPECLRKRSNIWALRAVYEAKSHVHNCMVTLTYDNFEYDDHGRIIGELPVNRDLKVEQRDVQLFIKRLRKWQSSFSDEKIKYIACAEYGSRTHRAHYHLILFGVCFSDIHFYKKSKRGNLIYMSSILSKLWSHGICTVDSISVHSAIARYCTKYCAKSRSDDTFMLTSQKIGFDGLLRDFNGLNYMIDGREYTVPRFIWNYYIESKYKSVYPYIDSRYVNRKFCNVVDENGVISREYPLFDSPYSRSVLARKYFREVRDSDPFYVRYLDYWMKKGLLFDSVKVPTYQRILQLDDRKFHFYKVAALKCYNLRYLRGLTESVPVIAPGSNCISRYFRYLLKYLPYGYCHLPPYSRPNRASDTVNVKFTPRLVKYRSKKRFLPAFFDNPPFFVQFAQLGLFDFL